MAYDTLTPIINNFNGGELTPLLDSRTDLQRYLTGCRTLKNFIPTIYGGAVRRPGTYYVAETKHSENSEDKKSMMVPFEYNVEQAYSLEFGEEYIRFFKNGGQIVKSFGTEDLSAHTANIIAHYLCNDNTGSGVVLDDSANSHDATLDVDTDTISAPDESATANKAFDLTANGGSHYITLADHADFSFGDDSDDSPFSVLVWADFNTSGVRQELVNKNTVSGNQEWNLAINTADKITVRFKDDTRAVAQQAKTISAVPDGWHLFAFTYDGRGGEEAAKGIKIYLDFVPMELDYIMDSSYVAMKDTTAVFNIGRKGGAPFNYWGGSIHNVAVLDKELSQEDILNLQGNDSTDPVEVVTPYQEEDLFEIHMRQSNDVLYLTHPNYKQMKLERYSHNAWRIMEIDFLWGPFMDNNTDTDFKLNPSASTGEGITITSTSPLFTSDHVGALFKLEHPKDNDNRNNRSGDLNVADTYGTPLNMKNICHFRTVENPTSAAKFHIERKPLSSTGYHQFKTMKGGLNYDIEWEEEEKDGARYRIHLEATTSGNLVYTLSCNQNYHAGYVKITGYTSSTEVTADVIVDLGSDNATWNWAEGEWSDERGYPNTVEFYQNRLIFGGTASEPLSVWMSVTNDFENFRAMTLAENDNYADESLIFRISSGQQNMIRWLMAQEALLVGTSGSEGKLQSYNRSAALTPTNMPEFRPQSSYGSSTIQPLMINDSTIFIPRERKKARDFKYDFNTDIFVAADLTLYSEQITGDGITQLSYQRQPEPILWSIREDGTLLGMTYERLENIYGWFRVVTDGEFESVTTISSAGQTTQEDEVWTIVKRTIGGVTKRFIEYFKPRDWGDDDKDVFFVDSGLQGVDNVSGTSIGGLDHLEGETVAVLINGMVGDSQVVGTGNGATTGFIDFYIDGVAQDLTNGTVCAGLPYTSELQPMKVEVSMTGVQTVRGRRKRIHEAVISFQDTLGGFYGRDSSNLDELDHSVTGTSGAMTPLKTEEIDLTFPGIDDIEGNILIRQTYPLPMTVRSIIPKLDVTEL
jgi:hypothetical protein